MAASMDPLGANDRCLARGSKLYRITPAGTAAVHELNRVH